MLHLEHKIKAMKKITLFLMIALFAVTGSVLAIDPNDAVSLRSFGNGLGERGGRRVRNIGERAQWVLRGFGRRQLSAATNRYEQDPSASVHGPSLAARMPCNPAASTGLE